MTVRNISSAKINACEIGTSVCVAAWNVDWYVYSAYKVYGPHMAALYGRADAIAELGNPNQG